MTAKLFRYFVEQESGIGFEINGKQYSLDAALGSIRTMAGENIPERMSMLEAALMVNQKPTILEQLEQFINDSKLTESCSIKDGWTFGVPLQPSKIIAVGRNYSEHAKELDHDLTEEPMLFAKLPSSMTAHQQPVIIPKDVGRVDHEIELAVFIGAVVKNISAEKAMGSVLGYTIFNDVTARDMQKAESAKGKPWMRAKGFDSFGPCGPYFIPASHLENPHSLELKLTVNGEVRQQGKTADMIFNIPTLISFISRTCTLFPGDIIITGTPSGVSPLNPGDVMVAEIEPIGRLESPVKMQS